MIFVQVEYMYCSLKPEKMFCCHSNHWKTSLKVAAYWFLKSGRNGNICILKTFPLIFWKRKKTETGEGLLRTRICSIMYNYFDSCEVPSPPFAGWDEPFRHCWVYQYNLYSSTNGRIDKIIKELANKCRHREQILYNV